MAETTDNPYSSLHGQMYIVLLCFGLVPLAVMGVAGLYSNLEAIETRTRNVLEAMVKNRKATVDLFLEEKMRLLELVASVHTVGELVRPGVLEAHLDRMQRGRGAIVDLGLIGGDGRHLAYTGPYNLQDRVYRDQPWFEHVMVLGRYESDIFLGFRRFPHMVMAVKKREDGRDYILRATIDTDILSSLVREGGLESGADVFILNRAGEFQTGYSDAHRLMEKSDVGPVPLHSGVRLVDRDAEGEREFMATAWLRNDSWVLVARQRLPGPSALLDTHSPVFWLFVIGVIAVPILSHLIARHRLRQIRALEARHVSQYESVAQSQKLAAVGRLAAGVAHEINNPLAVIQAQAGLITDVLADSPEMPGAGDLKERLKKIDAQVERAKKVTHRLLGFSRRVGPDREPVDLRAALDETVGLIEKEAAAADIRVARDYDADLPIVRTSLSQIQQVFLNLINNAMDAMARDGDLKLTTRRAGVGAEVSISDTGRGIAEKDIARIFEPFYSTKEGQGRHSGLGLAICQDIMHNLGGRISVESAVGTGTTFRLWFPIDVEAL